MLKEALRKVIFLKEVLKIVFLLKKVLYKKIWFSSQTKFWRSSQTHSSKCSRKALQKAFKEKSSQKSAKKVLRKAVGLKNRLKKIKFNQKNAQQSFFGQTSSHKREGSKKYSKWGNSLEIYIETLCDRQTSGMTRCYWTHQQKLWWFHNILVGKVESERSHVHVWVHKCARLGKVFYLVCSHACVLALARFEYSEDLKVSSQEVWLTWWNFSTVICSFKNLFVSWFRPYSFVLQIRVRKSRI